MSGHKLENISLLKVERMMVTYIIEGIFRGACQRLKEACHGSEGPHDNSRSRKHPDKINSSPGSTNSHGLAELKSLAGFFNALRSQPSPGASDELKFAFLSEFSWAALDSSVWRASSPKPKNCLEPPPLVSKPGRETPGSASPAPKFPEDLRLSLPARSGSEILLLVLGAINTEAVQWEEMGNHSLRLSGGNLGFLWCFCPLSAPIHRRVRAWGKSIEKH